MTTLTQSFTAALAANRLLQPADDSAKSYLLALINTDGGQPGGGQRAPEPGQCLPRASCAAHWRAATSPPPMPGCSKRAPSASAAPTSTPRKAELSAAREKAAQRTRVGGREHAAAHRIRGAEISVVDAQSRHRRLGGTGIHGAPRRLHRRHRRDQFQPAQDFRQCRHDGGRASGATSP